MDYVKLAWWVLGASVLIVLFTGAVVTYANRGSETIALGFAALLAAIVLFITQLFFQLRSDVREDAIPLQILVDRQERIAAAFQPADMMRAVVERDAGRWLASRNPDAFDEDDKLARDLASFSLLNFIAFREPDWQLKRTTVTFPAFGGAHQFFKLPSDPKKAQVLFERDLRAVLRSGNNLFAEGPLLGLAASVGVRLPKNTKVRLEEEKDNHRTTLVISAPVVTIRFAIQMASMIGGIPRRLPDGSYTIDHQGGRFALHLTRIEVSAAFAAYRAHDPQVTAYRAWYQRLAGGARDWFASDAEKAR